MKDDYATKSSLPHLNISLQKAGVSTQGPLRAKRARQSDPLEQPLSVSQVYYPDDLHRLLRQIGGSDPGSMQREVCNTVKPRYFKLQNVQISQGKYLNIRNPRHFEVKLIPLCLTVTVVLTHFCQNSTIVNLVNSKSLLFWTCFHVPWDFRNSGVRLYCCSVCDMIDIIIEELFVFSFSSLSESTQSSHADSSYVKQCPSSLFYSLQEHRKVWHTCMNTPHPKQCSDPRTNNKKKTRRKNTVAVVCCSSECLFSQIQIQACLGCEGGGGGYNHA